MFSPERSSGGAVVMTMLTLQQVAAGPGWVGPVTAISLAVMAAALVALVGGVLLTLMRLRPPIERLTDLLQGVQGDLGETMGNVRRLTEQGQDVLAVVRQEAGSYAQAGRRLRRQVLRGADRIQARLEDLESLYEVVHEEVEDTALDVAAALRSARSGNGMLGRVRRLLVPSRR
jgi:methyl-accepting chemotaxis protein